MKGFKLVSLLITSLIVVNAAPVSSPTGNSLPKRDYTTSSIASQVVDGTPCRAVTILYARGSMQEGNIGGPTELGPIFLNNVSALVGPDNLAVQGIDYNASLLDFADQSTGGDADAGAGLAMANFTTDVKERCPSTKLVLAGYSQGGYVVHGAIFLMPPEALEFVAAVQVFGDPMEDYPFGDIPTDKVNVDCHWLDIVCWGLGVVTPTHLNYQDDASDAANWVVSTIGV